MQQLKRDSSEMRGPALQYLMILVLFVVACGVIIVWHPWQHKTVRGLPTEVAPTTAPMASGR